jgi:V/A-type H+-transporting ATPase subunit E
MSKDWWLSWSSDGKNNAFPSPSVVFGQIYSFFHEFVPSNMQEGSFSPLSFLSFFAIVETIIRSEKKRQEFQMAIQIQELVASIRKDGVEAAQKDAQKIIDDAHAKADEIVAQAQKDAETMKTDAARDIAVRDQSARASLNQASRDVVLSLKKAIGAELDRLLEAKVSASFSGKELSSLITSVVKSGMVNTEKSEVQVSAKDFAALKNDLEASLAAELKKGLVIKPVENVDSGFRIADKDGSGFYSFSDEEIVSLMKPFLGEDLSHTVFDK